MGPLAMRNTSPSSVMSASVNEVKGDWDEDLWEDDLVSVGPLSSGDPSVETRRFESWEGDVCDFEVVPAWSAWLNRDPTTKAVRATTAQMRWERIFFFMGDC